MLEGFPSLLKGSISHEWATPHRVFDEIDQVLKRGGKCFIGDLRRDLNPLIKWFLIRMTKPKEIIPGLITSIQASYTVEEITAILRDSRLKYVSVKKNPIGLSIVGQKT